MKSELKKLQIAVTSARANVGRLKRIDYEVKMHILMTREYFTSPVEGDPEIVRITDPIGDFRMSNTDFESYCKLCFAELKQRGITEARAWDKVLYYPAEQTLKAAENALLDYSQTHIIPVHMQEDYKLIREDYDARMKARDLTMQLHSRNCA